MPIQMIRGTIVDANYHETLRDDLNNDIYENSVVMLIRDDDTGKVFVSALSESEIRDIVNRGRANKIEHLSSMDMIHFAQELRQREEPVAFLANPDQQEITTEMIQKLMAEPESSPKRSRVSKTNGRFAMKDRASETQ